MLDRWREARALGEPVEIEARLRRHDGSFRWFLFRVEPLRDQSGKIVKWYATSTDIQDLKTTEQELRDVLDHIPQHIGIRAPEGRPLFANRFGLDYAGLTLEE